MKRKTNASNGTEARAEKLKARREDPAFVAALKERQAAAGQEGTEFKLSEAEAAMAPVEFVTRTIEIVLSWVALRDPETALASGVNPLGVTTDEIVAAYDELQKDRKEEERAKVRESLLRHVRPALRQLLAHDRVRVTVLDGKTFWLPRDRRGLRPHTILARGGNVFLDGVAVPLDGKPKEVFLKAYSQNEVGTADFSADYKFNPNGLNQIVRTIREAFKKAGLPGYLAEVMFRVYDKHGVRVVASSDLLT